MMMRKNILCIICVFAIMLLSGCKNRENQKIIVGVSADYPPFAFEYNDAFIGFDIELVDAIADKLKYEVEFKKVDFQNLFSELEEKKIDVIASAVTKTKGREEKFAFSHPYYNSKFALVYKKNRLKQIIGLDDMDGVVGVEKNTTMEGVARSKYFSGYESQDGEGDVNNNTDESIAQQDSKEYLKLYDSHGELIHALEKDDVDGVILEVLQAEVVTQNNNELTYIMIPNEKNEHYYYGFVFNKDSKLVDKFNKVLDELDLEGKVDILKLRWFSGYGMYNNSQQN